MSNVWFISDTHFYQASIIRYCHRPWNSGTDDKGNPIIMPEDTEKMNAEMIENWNAVVKPGDVVWHLGDFARQESSIGMIKDIVSQLNGKISFVMGNHDVLSTQKYTQCGFAHVYEKPVNFDDGFLLSHKPVAHTKIPENTSNIFGHIHIDGRYRTFTPNTACVCVERHNYAPISFDYIKSELQKQREAS